MARTQRERNVTVIVSNRDQQAAAVPRQGAPRLRDLREAGLSSAEAARQLAESLSLPLATADDFPEEAVLAEAVAVRYLRDVRAVPLAALDSAVTLAMADPGDEQAAHALALAFGLRLDLQVASTDDIDAALERLYGPGKSALEQIVDDIDDLPGEGGADDDVQHLKDLALEAPVVRLVNQLLHDAVARRASDLHIEPFRNRITVRFRIDGMLREVKAPPAQLAKAIVSRIKILSGLNIAERRLPQDGRARMRIEGKQIDLRVATMPTMHGESVVIRLLDDSSRVPELSGLGLAARAEKILRRHLDAPHGMIVVTGPTGSGKTTTLSAALNLLNQPHRKIVTVEDPVEYQLPGVNQLQVKPQIGLTFANALRAFVRQDPDVIMVGEMRDGETADIAVHAALTGHLVLTTLHTNNAAGAVTRLLDMGVDAYLLASTLRCLVAQRLVRLLCKTCSRPTESPGPQITPLIERGLLDRDHLDFREPVGCDVCGGSGFVGRIAIVEMLEITEGVQDLVRPGVGTRELMVAGQRQGMTTMLEDGMLKAAAGLTTPEEVWRVTEDV